jgi:hypothetical protein
MTESHLIDRLSAGVAVAACIVALFLPWEHNSISGAKTGLKLLQSSSDRPWLAWFLISIAIAAIAALSRHPLLTIAGHVAAACLLLRIAAEIRSNLSRSIGKDSLGRVFERDVTSTLGAGFYVAAALVVLVGGRALLSAVDRYCR